MVKICSECGCEIQDSRKDSAELSATIKMLKMIKVAGIKETEESMKDCCVQCKKKAYRTVMKPFAQALGKTAEDW